MFQGERAILKRGMAVRHGWVSRIAGISKQGQIGEGQLLHQLSAFVPGLSTVSSPQPRMQQQRAKGQRRQGQDQEQVG